MRYLIDTTAALLLGSLAVAASAQKVTTPLAPAVTTPPQAATRWPSPLPADKLDNQRGGTDTVTTQATLSGSVADNTARNVVTGNNVIDNGAFANMSGLPMVIQNTGANVLIQNATVINLQMR